MSFLDIAVCASVQFLLYFNKARGAYGRSSRSSLSSDRLQGESNDAPVFTMPSESSQTELARLRREQSQTRQEEVFGGLSLEERVEYDLKGDRIRQLERELLVQAEVRVVAPRR
jgi:hypothetical protein